jgi:autotransporter-associated beta strand protein
MNVVKFLGRLSGVSVIFATVLLAPAALATGTDTWVGGSGNNFSTAANWSYSSGSGPVASGDLLVFGAAGSTTPDNDENNFTFAGIIFNSGASAYAIGGNAFSLGGSISNGAANAQVINNNITLAANETVNTKAGNVTLGGNIDDGGHGYGLTKSGTSGSILTLTGANTFRGALNLNAGTVAITALNSLGAGSSISFGGSSSSTISESAATSLTIPATTTMTVNSSSTCILKNNTPATTFEIAALITGSGGCSQSSSAGTVRFDNDGNNYSGGFSMGFGTVEFTSVADGGSASALGAGSASYTIGNSMSAGIFRCVGSTSTSTSRAINWTATTGGLSLDSSGSGTVQFLATSSLRSGSGANTITLTGANSGPNTLAQAISDSGGTTILSKSGIGTWILSGANSYSGNTIITAGMLEATAPGALPNYSASGKVSVSAGATLAIQVGGSGWTSANVDSLRSAVAFANNAAVLAMDTANGDFSYGSSISQPIALAKLGANTLTLSAANAYSGDTTINGGTLALSGAGSIAGSPAITLASGAIFDVSGLAGGFTVSGGQTLAANGATGIVNGNVSIGSGSLMLAYTNGTPAMSITGGTLTMNNNSVTVTVAGSTPLPAGTYKLISKGAGGSVAGAVSGSVLSVNGAGAAANTTTSLQVTGAGLYLSVNSTASTAASISSSANPQAFGNPVTFTASISPSNATGTVTFLDGATTLGTATLTGGQAIIIDSVLAVGSHPITASYGGDLNNRSSTSGILTQIINPPVPPYPQGTAFPLMFYEVDDAPSASSVVPYAWTIIQSYGLNTTNEVNSYLQLASSDNIAAPDPIPSAIDTNGNAVEWPQSQVQAWLQASTTNANIACWYFPEELNPSVPGELHVLSDYSQWTRLYDPSQRPNFDYQPNDATDTRISQVAPYLDIIGLGCYCEAVNQPHAWVRYRIQQAGLHGVALAGKTQGSNYLSGQKTVMAVLYCALPTNNQVATPQQAYHDVWSAIASGAQGIAVYSYWHAINDGAPALTNNLQQYNLAASQISGSQIGQMVLFGIQYTNVTFNISSGPASTVSFTPPGWTNISYPSINLLCKTWSNNVYLIAVNSTSNSLTASITNLPVSSATAALPFESRSVMINGAGFSDVFPPWGVHVYEIAPPPPFITSLAYAGGTVTLLCSGTPYNSYVLQCSTNLVTWTNISTHSASSLGTFSITNAGAPNQAAFYRLQQP